MDNELELKYKENAQLFRHILDWRYRIITLFTALIGGFAVLIKWTANGRFYFIPYILFTAACIILFLIERINRRIIDKCEGIGRKLEVPMTNTETNIFSQIFPEGDNYFIHSESKLKLSYSKFLLCLYLGAGILSFLVVIFLSWFHRHGLLYKISNSILQFLFYSQSQNNR